MEEKKQMKVKNWRWGFQQAKIEVQRDLNLETNKIKLKRNSFR